MRIPLLKLAARAAVIVALTLAFSIAQAAIDNSQNDADGNTPAADTASFGTGFSPYTYEGYLLQVPAGCVIHTDRSTGSLTAPDGSFGFTISVDKDKNSSQPGAVEICKQLLMSWKLSDASVKKVTINGLKGATLRGKAGPDHIAVAIIDGKGSYLRLIVMSKPNRTDWVDHTIASLRPAGR